MIFTVTTIKPTALQSICIFRLSAIGDVTHVLPVVNTLKARFPAAKLTWVVGRLEHRLLHGLPDVEFIEFNKSAGWSGIKALRQQLRGRQFDVLLQMQLSLRANLVSRLIKARRRIGYDRIRSKELHGLAVNERIPYLKDCHVLDGLMQFATYLGCEEPVFAWQIPVSQTDQDWAADKIKPKRPNVIISPCSSHALRNWSNERYAQLVDHLVQDYQAHVMLCASPAAKEMATTQAIADLCQSPVTDLAGQDTLKQLLCLMHQADLVVSPDSGPLHMAGSVGTPVIGLLAASNYRRSGSYQYPDLTVDAYPEACQLFLKRPVDKVKWGTKTEFAGAMDLIEVADVVAKIKQADEQYRWSQC